jgi:putative transposase
MNELKTRGIQDILLVVADGPAGFPKVAAAGFPKTKARPRMDRNSARFAPYKDRKTVIAGLKSIRRETDRRGSGGVRRNVGHETPDDFPSWRNRRTEDIPFFKVSPEIRKAARAANAIEPVNFTIQKIIKHRLSFPKDEVAMKLIFMGLKNISGKWTTPIWDWGRPQSIRRHLRGRQSPTVNKLRECIIRSVNSLICDCGGNEVFQAFFS